MTEPEKIRIHELVCKSLEGMISPEECRELESWMASDTAARTEYYSKCVDICLGLTRIQQIISDPLNMTNYLQEMAEYERTAEIVPSPREVFSDPQLSVLDINHAYPIHKPRRLSLYTAIVTSAALVLMLLYVHFIPRPVSQEVATVLDSIHTKWLDPAASVKVGSRLWTNQGSVTLKEGILAIRYDNGVEVVIQAPAEYELLTPTEISINYGRLYAKVSEAGRGFTVKTRNSRIIDLGTEFGVLADVQGDTQLHVFKGKTTLIAGGHRSDKKIIDVPAGRAMEVESTGVRDIELKKTAFARVIDSQTGLIWKGEESLDMSDIIGGGNGLHGIYSAPPITGHDIFRHPFAGPREFLPIDNSLFVEGIFIPNGAQGPIPVVRDGSIMWNAPVTEVRQKIGYLRFDIAGVKRNFSNAFISMYVSSWEGKKLSVQVYGLKDGSGDLWEESRICYNNAPGFNKAPLGQYNLDPDAVENLGTITLDGLGVKRSSISNLAMDSFIRRDTNGLLTFILICDSSDPGDDWKMTTKEGDVSQAPKLVLPYPATQTVAEITTAQGRGADTYLSNDNQYSSTDADGTHGTESVIKIRDYSKDPVYISNGPTVQFEENGQIKIQTLAAGGGQLDAMDNTVIGMRAISGITVDLQKIRNYYARQFTLESFTASCGLAETMTKSPRVSFYVLVDGVERFVKLNVAPSDPPCPIQVKLSEQDRYLTLVVAHGTDKKSSRDWGFFACPRLNFE